MIEISEPNDVENSAINPIPFTTMMNRVVLSRTVPVRAIMTRPTPSRMPSSTGKVKKPMSATEKIIARKSGSTVVSPGQNVWVNVDTLMTHDVCGPGTFGVFEKEFGKDAEVWDPNRVILIPDHYIFTDDPRANRNVDMLRFSHFLTLFESPNVYLGNLHISMESNISMILKIGQISKRILITKECVILR